MTILAQFVLFTLTLFLLLVVGLLWASDDTPRT
jgi:hypothetical protein